jgi:hypothetical protein
MVTHLYEKHDIKLFLSLAERFLVIAADVDQPTRQVTRQGDTRAMVDLVELIAGHDILKSETFVAYIKVVPDCGVGEVGKGCREAM